VRVAHPWAGNRWGAIHVPRVGNEVVVEFLEGDPDRPLVTGSVYNADNMPPYTLPENKTQSGIKSRSSKGGTEANFNEIRLEDKKGHEELHIQAERNMSTLVKHDQSLTVQADRKVTVHGASMATYQGGRSETVQNGDTLTVERSDKTTMVGGEYNIVAVKHYNVSSGESAVCDVDLKEGVATITAAKEIDLVCGDASLSLKKDGLATITAAKEIKLECGEASLSLKSDGTVTIQGKKTLSATGAGAKLELAAAGAKLSGQNATVSGKTMTEISGGMVKIN
jgi:type VI secretion system secreted protein VgrG